MQGKNVASLEQFRNRPRDWTTQELAEFYRVESALIQVGMRITSDRGLSDEGDPWFVFCREDDTEPVVHFARIDGQYIIASSAYRGISSGLDFRSMVQNLIARHKLVPRGDEKSSNIFLHPAALLIIVVGAAFFKTQAQADEIKKDLEAQKAHGPATAPLTRILALINDLSSANDSQVQSDHSSNHELSLIATAAILAANAEDQTQVLTDGYSSGSRPTEETGDAVAAFGHASLVSRVSLGPEMTDAASDLSALAANTSAHISSSGPENIFAAALDLRAEVNHIALTHTTPLFDEIAVFAKTPGSMFLPPAYNLNSAVNLDAALSTTKTFVTNTSTLPTVMAPTASVDASQNNSGKAEKTVNVAGKLATDSPANVVFQEFATTASHLPDNLTNLTSYASVDQHSGSATNFLIQNSIFITTQSETITSSTSAPSSNADIVAVQPTAKMDAKSTGPFPISKQPTDSQPASGPLDSSRSSSAQPSDANSTVAKFPGSHSASIDATATNSHDIAVSSTGLSDSKTILSTDVFLKTLETFIQDTPNMKIVVSNEHYVFAGSPANNATALLESVTMTFTDGSSISVVGQQQLLYNIIFHLH